MNSNKILFITSEFPPQPGGIGNHAFNLSDSLRKEGLQLTVLTDIRSKNGAPEKVFDNQLNFNVKRIKRRNLIWLSYFDRFFKAMRLITKNDTVIASGKFSLWLVFFLKLFYNKKYIAIIHGSELMLPNSYQRKFSYASLKNFNRIIAVSNYTKNLISDLNLDTIEVIPNGFSVSNDENKHQIQHQLEHLNLITVGNVSQRKGQQNVVKAIPILLKTYPNLKYRIVGIPTEKDNIENLAKELEVEENIEFYGKVSEEKRNQLLASSSIFMMLSEKTGNGAVEGFGIAVLEANAFGIPAIGSKGCGIEDAINHKETGCLVDETDINSVLEAINEINHSYLDYSKNAIQWSKKFSWKKIVIQYLEILNK